MSRRITFMEPPVNPPRSFIGRARELDELRTALAEAISGRGGLMLVSGEPGIGKTRLAEELDDYARGTGALVLWGRCWEGDGPPAFWPWVQIIRSLSESVTTAELATSLGTGTAYVAGIVPELAERLGSIPPAPTSPESPNARFHLFDAITMLLKKISRERPLLVVLDDLHWADRSSLLLLEFVAKELRDARMLVIGTYREGEVRADVAVTEVVGGLSREARSVPLRGLSEAEVALLMERSGGRKPDARLVAAVHHGTDGNPFFVDEIVRLLAAEGITEAQAGERLPIPVGVRSAIRRRLSHLPDAIREVLAIAAVIGREFELAVLERASGRNAGELLGALGTAREVGILGSRGRIDTHAFTHAVIRETLYDDLPPPERVRLHRRIGEALEEIHVADLERRVAEVAHHFLEAAPDGDLDKALGYAERAGHRALAMHAYEEAAQHFEHALRIGTLQKIADARRAELLLQLGRAVNRAGDFEKAAQVFREAAGLARKLGLPAILSRVALDFGMKLSADPQRTALLTEAVEVLPREDSALRALVMASLAVELIYAADAESAVALVEEAAAMARRLDDPPTLARTEVARCQVLWIMPIVSGRPAPPFDVSRVVEELGDKEVELDLRAMRIRAYTTLGHGEAARREIAAFVRTAEELRQPWRTGFARIMRAWVRIFDGRLDEAEGFIAGAFQHPDIAVQLAGTFRTLRKLQGRVREFAEMSGARSRFQGGSMALVSQCARTADLAEIGDEAGARRKVDSLAAKNFADVPRGLAFLCSLAFLSEACEILGDRARAALLYDLLYPFAGHVIMVGGPASAYGDVSHHLGLLATTLARYGDAERHFADAVAKHEKLGARPWAVLTRYHLAKMLIARGGDGDGEQASQLLDEALAAAEEIGMQGVVAGVRSLRSKTPPAQTNASGAERSKAPSAPTEPTRFVRGGGHWTIDHEGVVFRLKDSKGLRTIAELLRNPGVDRHVAELVALAEGAGADDAAHPDSGELAAQGLRVGSLGDAGEHLDAHAKAAYRTRLQDLREDLAEAERMHDAGRAEQARQEIEVLGEELARAVGLGGRDRKAAAATERARLNVTRAVRSALEKIADFSPALHAHLDGAIRTGTYCSYRPGPRDSISWVFDPV